jgi:hypothetical protein
MTATTDINIMPGVNRLMDRFSTIPQDWAVLIAEHIDKDECVAMPMYGRLFKAEDSGLAGLVSNLLDTTEGEVPTDPADIVEWVEAKGFNLEGQELSILALCAADPDELDDAEDDIEAIRDDLMEQWRDSSDEDRYLYDCGWMDVGGPGFIAREFDGYLMLGVNGCGYDFVESHWTKLYQELGLNWHPTGEDE